MNVPSLVSVRVSCPPSGAFPGGAAERTRHPSPQAPLHHHEPLWGLTPPATHTTGTLTTNRIKWPCGWREALGCLVQDIIADLKDIFQAGHIISR